MDLLGHGVHMCLALVEIIKQFSKVVYRFILLPTGFEGLVVCNILSLVLLSFSFIHSGKRLMMSKIGLTCISWMPRAYLHLPISCLDNLVSEVSVQIFYPCIYWLSLFHIDL